MGPALDPDRGQLNWRSCGLAIGLPMLGAIFKAAVLRRVLPYDAFLAFYPAVGIAALYGGMSAGLVATVVSAAFATYLWVDPAGAGPEGATRWLGVGAFLAASGSIVLLVHLVNRARARVRDAEAERRAVAEAEREAESRRLIDELELARSGLRHSNDEVSLLTQRLRISDESVELRAKARSSDLQWQTAELRALARHLSRADEQDRRRVAQTIHDQLQQLLAAARMSLELASRQSGTPELKAELRRIDDLVGEALVVARTLTSELCPSVLYRSGLVKAVRWLVQWFEERHGLRVALTIEQEIEVPSEEMRIALFRGIHELLTNVVKHAGVMAANVRISRLERAIQIIVSDNGDGFEAGDVRGRHAASGGFGLFALRERLQSFGATLEIDSGPNDGTRVTILAPLPKFRQAETGDRGADQAPDSPALHTATEPGARASRPGS